MTFALYELALNKDVQDKLRKEIVEAVEKGEGKLSYDTIFELKYLDMVINETMRKFPPAFILFRTCSKAFKIPGTEMIIPKGTDIHINIYSLHHDPEYFPNPEKFDPERFSAENAASIVPFSYFPFGGGQRSCVGRRFGLMQSKVGIIKLIQNFEFSVCDKTSIPLKFLEPTLFLTPLNKMWLKVTKVK
jgi:cytochrome P450 family 6